MVSTVGTIVDFSLMAGGINLVYTGTTIGMGVDEHVYARINPAEMSDFYAHVFSMCVYL